jgi:spore germination cell wall hydrolase CwlJ-like protein
MSCLSNAIFYEANTESETGKRLVAVAILNRTVKQDKSICSIIKQPSQSVFYKTGFNWSTRATHAESVEIVVDVLRKSVLGLQTSYGGITHFHALSVKPAFCYKQTV